MPEEQPIFFNQISQTIKFLQNYNKITLIGDDLVGLIYKDYNLVRSNSINYFCGNQRLIIEFDGRNSTLLDIMLILNPLDVILYNKFALVFALRILDDYNKIEIYKDLLYNQINLNDEILQNLLNNNIIIINYEKFINNSNLYHIEKVGKI